jgi:hypothetical protein
MVLEFLAARFFVPVALRRLEANSESLRERAMRWGEKDADEKFKDLPAHGINDSNSYKAL